MLNWIGASVKFVIFAYFFTAWICSCGASRDASQGASDREMSQLKYLISENNITLGIIPSFDNSAFLFIHCDNAEGFKKTKDFYKEQKRVAYTVKKFALTQNCYLPIGTELYKENINEAKSYISQDLLNKGKQVNFLVQALSQFIPGLREKIEQESYERNDWLQIFTAGLNELEQSQDVRLNNYLFIKLENYIYWVLNRTLAFDKAAQQPFNWNALTYKVGLSALLQSRCFHYQGIGPANILCLKAAWDMVDDLDFSLKGGASAGRAMISFTSEVKRLIQQEVCTQYLKDLTAQLDHAQDEGRLKYFNVYSWSKNYFGSDQQALQYMATLFQDYVLLAQLNYLQMSSFAPDKQNLVMSNIAMVEKILNLATQSSKIMRFGALDDIEPQGDRGYHFFVPAYLSFKLKERGYSDQLASALPFIFNTVYEYARDVNVSVFDLVDQLETPITPKFNIGEGGGDGNDPWSKFITILHAIDDPATLSDWKDQGTIEDIYYGYAGAHLGINLNKQEVPRAQPFLSEFLPNPRAFIQANFFSN